MERRHETSPWLAQCQRPMTAHEERQVLTTVLCASASAAAALQQLALATACPAVVRCAALDRYVGVMGIQATPLLEALADFRREQSEPVRTVAHQWLAWVAFHTDRAPALAEEWRAHGVHDPSPRVQWLASLPRYYVQLALAPRSPPGIEPVNSSEVEPLP